MKMVMNLFRIKTGVNKYGIVYKCSNEASGINSDQDFIDDINDR